MSRKVTRCSGEGQGSCTRCIKQGIWNRTWMCFLNKIEGLEGTYCDKCTRIILNNSDNEEV